jgi:hypothetical protein
MTRPVNGFCITTRDDSGGRPLLTSRRRIHSVPPGNQALNINNYQYYTNIYLLLLIIWRILTQGEMHFFGMPGTDAWRRYATELRIPLPDAGDNDFALRNCP